MTKTDPTPSSASQQLQIDELNKAVDQILTTNADLNETIDRLVSIVEKMAPAIVRLATEAK